MARELFTLRPRPRAARRLAWLDNRMPSVNWPDAVGRFWATDAPAADLDPSLVAFLDDESPPPTAVEAATPPRATRSYRDDDDRPRPYRRREPVRESSSGGSPWAGRLGIGGAVFGILLVVRIIAACAGASKTPSYSPSYTPAYTYPTPPTFRFEPPPEKKPARAEFNTIEVLRFQQYERSKTGPEPDRYYLWVAAGRPKATR
jgi:hypothetical protein